MAEMGFQMSLHPFLSVCIHFQLFITHTLMHTHTHMPARAHTDTHTYACACAHTHTHTHNLCTVVLLLLDLLIDAQLVPRANDSSFHSESHINHQTGHLTSHTQY